MPFANRRPGVADLLYVMATELEYGPELRSRISPLVTGIGPVEAAAGVTERLTRLAVEDKLPLMVVSLGSAGSAELEQCGLYQASSVSWRDMDASPLGFERGVVPYLDQPAIIPLGPFVPGIPLATLSTGGDIVSGEVYDLIDAEMVDMETYAVLRACQRFGLPLVAIRGISDGDREIGYRRLDAVSRDHRRQARRGRRSARSVGRRGQSDVARSVRSVEMQHGRKGRFSATFGPC